MEIDGEDDYIPLPRYEKIELSEAEASLLVLTASSGERGDFSNVHLIEADRVFAVNENVNYVSRVISRSTHKDNEDEERKNKLAIAALLESDRLERERSRPKIDRAFDLNYPPVDAQPSTLTEKALAKWREEKATLPCDVQKELESQVSEKLNVVILAELIAKMIQMGVDMRVINVKLEEDYCYYSMKVQIDYASTLTKCAESRIAEIFKHDYDWQVTFFHTFSHVKHNHFVTVCATLPEPEIV